MVSMPQPFISIDGCRIGDDAPPYMIAEISGNHNGDLGRAMALIDTAKAAGADAVKLQTYTADTLTIDHDSSDFRIEGGAWDGRTLYDLYEEAHTPWDWHEALFTHARSIGITVFSSPFDETAVDFLEALDCPAYKIASFEAADFALLKKVAATGKPLIISTGVINMEEIGETLDIVHQEKNDQVALLHCISSYPAAPEDMNLRAITNLQNRFDTVVGLSDHSLGTTASITSIALGAAIIEKHFTLDRSDGGPDAAFSLEPEELKELCSACRTASLALGEVGAPQKSSTQKNAKFRRSLYVVRDILAGETFTPENVRSIRPGFGLAPKYLGDVIGRKSNQNIARGTALSLDFVMD